MSYKNLNFNVWDLGGQTSIRPYWRCYYANTAAVIFVIDSTDIERLETAATELKAMLDEEEIRDAALLVFANKQDQPGAKGAPEISEALRLGELKDRNWTIMACSAVDGRGVTEGMDWLVVRHALCRRVPWFSQTDFASKRSRLLHEPSAMIGERHPWRSQQIAHEDNASSCKVLAAKNKHWLGRCLGVYVPTDNLCHLTRQLKS